MRTVVSFLLLALAGCSGAMTSSGPGGPAQTAYAPPSGKGPIVVLLSGHSGPGYYQSIAGAVAKIGYYAGNLARAIERAQTSPHAVAGKAAVIGFSRGGGGSLVFAADMPEQVSASSPTTRRPTSCPTPRCSPSASRCRC